MYIDGNIFIYTCRCWLVGMIAHHNYYSWWRWWFDTLWATFIKLQSHTHCYVTFKMSLWIFFLYNPTDKSIVGNDMWVSVFVSNMSPWKHPINRKRWIYLEFHRRELNSTLNGNLVANCWVQDHMHINIGTI
jgi:hypothetical protein